MKDIYIAKCPDYSEEAVGRALEQILCRSGLLDFIKPDMTVGIKANLVSFMKPETAATTHPEVLRVLCNLIVGKGASVIIGDSPGGLYNQAFVGRVYTATGMRNLVCEGVRLNENFEQRFAEFPEGKVLKTFHYTAWLDECDAIINFCKLKSHGMMGMSAAVKNMFGVIPGTMKPEYHFRFKEHTDFADMMVDLNEYFKPSLCICDGVIGMEGNGPTAGTPREIGLLLASASPYKLDLACAHIIGLGADKIPTLASSIKRGLAPENISDLSVEGDLQNAAIPDFENVEIAKSLQFAGKGSILGRVFGGIVGTALASKPVLVPKECVGCQECFKICPAKAITMKNNKPVIDRKKCIRCFCCQEFCPKGALKVKRTPIAKLLNK